MRNLKLLAASISLILAAGCTTSEEMRVKVSEEMTDSIESLTPQRQTPGLVRVSSSKEIPGSSYADIDVDEDSGSVNIKISGRIGPVLQGYADTIGYGLSWTDGVSRNKSVSMSLAGVSEKNAIRKLSAAAGYVAIFNHKNKMVTIAKEATYVFRLPQHLLREESTDFAMTGENSSNGGSGGSSSSGSGSSNNSSPAALAGRAKFSSTGKISTASSSIENHLKQLAGVSASISVNNALGHVTVRGSGITLERVRSYLQRIANQSMRQVKIDVAIVDVGLGSESELGIDWTRALKGLGGKMNLALATAADVANPAASVVYTSASVNSIINSLKQNRDVKIVTQPQLTATNGVPTMIFDGQEIPYVGEISSSATDSVVTQSATVSYASDGVSLSAITDVLNDSEAHLTLVPSISTVQALNAFQIGDNQIVAPVRTSKEALISTTLRDGQTAVIGGIRYTARSKKDKVLPIIDAPFGMNRKNEARELAIIMRAHITPERQHPIMFSETL